MKSKGSQFEQLEMFPGYGKVPVPHQPGDGKPVNLNADRDAFVEKFGSTPEDPYNWNQAELPHGMHVRGELPDRTALKKSYEWVPTWNVETEQPSVSRNKFLYFNTTLKQQMGGRDPEGQEGPTYQDMPWSVKYEGAAEDGGDLHILADGNHRITAERHRGAMFHRLGSYQALHGASPPRRIPQRPWTLEELDLD